MRGVVKWESLFAEVMRLNVFFVWNVHESAQFRHTAVTEMLFDVSLISCSNESIKSPTFWWGLVDVSEND